MAEDVQRQRKRAQVHLQLALALHQKGDLDGALDNYDAVLAIDDAQPKVHNNLEGTQREWDGQL